MQTKSYSETSDFSICCPKCEKKLIRTYMMEDRTLTCPECGFTFYLFIDKNMSVIMSEEDINTPNVMKLFRRLVISTGRGITESNNDTELNNFKGKIDIDYFDSIDEVEMRLSDLFQEYQKLAYGTCIIESEQLMALLEFLQRDRDIEVHRVKGCTRVREVTKKDIAKKKRYKKGEKPTLGKKIFSETEQ